MLPDLKCCEIRSPIHTSLCLLSGLHCEALCRLCWIQYRGLVGQDSSAEIIQVGLNHGEGEFLLVFVARNQQAWMYTCEGCTYCNLVSCENHLRLGLVSRDLFWPRNNDRCWLNANSWSVTWLQTILENGQFWFRVFTPLCGRGHPHRDQTFIRLPDFVLPRVVWCWVYDLWYSIC